MSEVLLLRNNNVPEYVNIASNVSLVRDTYSMGILNINENELQAYRTKKKLALEKIAEDRRKDIELNTLKDEVAQLKQLVLQLVEKQNADLTR
jgi:hypothetical protein